MGWILIHDSQIPGTRTKSLDAQLPSLFFRPKRSTSYVPYSPCIQLFTDTVRQMPVTREVFLELRDGPSPSHSITSRKTKVRSDILCNVAFRGNQANGKQARRQESRLQEGSLISAVSTATLRCQELLVISNSRRVPSLPQSSRSLQPTQTLPYTIFLTMTSSWSLLVMVRFSLLKVVKNCANLEPQVSGIANLPKLLLSSFVEGSPHSKNFPRSVRI